MTIIIGKRSNGYDNVLTLVKGKPEWGKQLKLNQNQLYMVISKLKKLIQDHNLIVKSITIDNGIEFESNGFIRKMT